MCKETTRKSPRKSTKELKVIQDILEEFPMLEGVEGFMIKLKEYQKVPLKNRLTKPFCNLQGNLRDNLKVNLKGIF